MSPERTTHLDGRDALAAESLYVLRVQDRIDGRIAGHDGTAYVSPPASRESTLALVALLLGSDPHPVNGATSWTRAVPGGRRTITLELTRAD